jgi:hypothetical protein
LSKNVTVPVGVPGEVEVTVAVSVTDCPVVEGFADDVTAVVVAAGPPPETTRITTEDLAGEKKLSPMYAAVMECEPATSEEVAKVP